MKIWKILKHNDVIKSWCNLHFRQYRIIQTIDICFIMYFLINFKYQYLYRCFILWKCIFKTSQFFKYSIAYFTIRFCVIFEINKFIEFRFARFYNFRIDVWFNFKKFTSSKKFVRKFQTIHYWKNYIVEKVYTKISNQIEFVKILNRKHKRML